MKLALAVLAALLATVAVPQGAISEDAAAKAPPTLQTPRRILPNAPGSLSVFPDIVVVPGLRQGKGAFRGRGCAPRLRLHPGVRLAEPLRPQPGVYEAFPYTGIVVVPDAHLDDGCIVAPSVPVPPMPMLRPELRLIPRSPGVPK